MGTAIEIPSHVRWMIDSDGAVLLDLKIAKYYSLNGIGAAIWSKVENGLNPSEIASSLVEIYDVPAETFARDISVFIEQLRAERLIDVGG